MSAIIPFQFETKAVRVQLDELEQPWFNANDVCDILEFRNARQGIETHVDEEDVQKLDIIDKLGRIQRANHINESGVYALIMGSTKDTAKRFKRWVTSEVLPTIRKTGGYGQARAQAILPGPTQDRVSAILLMRDWLAKVPGVKQGMAAALTLRCIEENTGISTEVVRRGLPPANEPICTLNPTQLGKQLNCSAKATNQLLAANGFQFRNGYDEWELTKAGEAWAEALPYTRNGHSGYQILWNPAVKEALKNVA